MPELRPLGRVGEAMSAPRWKVPYLDGEGLIEVVPASSYDALLAERTRPVTTSLTPEQMNEAVRVAIDAQSSVPAEEYNDDWGMRTVVTALLPVLFAAWQEQTAAKAGDNPVPDEAGAHAQQAWDEGAMYPDRSSE